MGRLEKQIIIGALALVGVLLTVVVLKGLKPRDAAGPELEALNGWGPGNSPDLIVRPPSGSSTIPLDAGPRPAVDPQAGTGAEIVPAVLPRGGKDTRAEASVLTPVPPPPVETEPAVSHEPRKYTVQDGEVLSGIAERELGSVRYVSAILDLNPGLDADHISAGDVLWIPARSSLRAKTTPSVERAPASDGLRRHVVVSGDSLSGISKKYYGTTREFGRIVRANPDLLHSENTTLRIGWELVIPALD